jgi:GMP synthase (glutamine-hydrolysing)
MTKLLLLKVGFTFDHIARARGDYDAWFRQRLERPNTSLEVVHVARGEPLPQHFEYDGVVVTGSFSMVTDREGWSVATAGYLRGVVERRVPTLGVCYGHQLLADTFGGRVANNPRGRQAGTVSVQLTPDAQQDPLFRGMPSVLRVQVSHRQSVLVLPEGAVLLGSCEGDPHHAYRLGDTTWGVQFHPEFDADVSRAYIEARREILASEGLNPAALTAAVEDSDHGPQILTRFRELVDQRRA